jgi:hypothetical protein
MIPLRCGRPIPLLNADVSKADYSHPRFGSGATIDPVGGTAR